MSGIFDASTGRLTGASVAVLISALALGGSVMLWSAAPSIAAAGASTNDEVAAATTKLELLHQRAMAKGNRMDDSNRGNAAARHGGHAISPEQAVKLAQHFARTSGDPTAKQSSIELQKRNGRAVYAVRLGARSVYIDAETGTVG